MVGTVSYIGHTFLSACDCTSQHCNTQHCNIQYFSVATLVRSDAVVQEVPCHLLSFPIFIFPVNKLVLAS